MSTVGEVGNRVDQSTCTYIKRDGCRCGAPTHGDSPFCFVHDPAYVGQNAQGSIGIAARLRSRMCAWRLQLGLRRARRAGAVIGEGCRFADLPDFGSEPYLIRIGRDVRFAPRVAMITHDGGIRVIQTLDPERYGTVHKFGRIEIRDNCVIGWGAIILPGVRIGPDCVIAAGSVVTRSIPPGVLAAGNPARPVMSIQGYAEWSLAATLNVDEEEYRRDPKACLMNASLRMSAPLRWHRDDSRGTRD